MDLWRERCSAWWNSAVPMRRVASVSIALVCGIAFAVWSLDLRVESSADQTLGIQGLIKKVRDELAAAEDQMRAEGRQALFDLKEMEMEIRFTVNAGGQLKVETAGFGGIFDRSSERAQTLRLKWVVAGQKSGTTQAGGKVGAPTEVREIGPAGSATQLTK